MGNIGVMLVGVIYKINIILGIICLCIIFVLLMIDGKNLILFDVGFNVDVKFDVFYQFVVFGLLYVKCVYGIENLCVGLLNIGEEEIKGNLLMVVVYKLLFEFDEINFIGNVEGNCIFIGVVDVIVCDGFIGNVVLKEVEGIYFFMKKCGIQDEYFDCFNYENYGGILILGVKGNVIIGYGIFNDKVVKLMLLNVYEVVKFGFVKNVNKVFNQQYD